MHTGLHIVLEVCFCLGLALILIVGLLSVLQDLLERISHDSPLFDDPPELPQQDAAAKSQFAWQSRPRSQERD